VPLPGDLYRYADAESTPFKLSANGTYIQPRMERGFAVLLRRWEDGDTVELDLPMPVRRVLANEKVEENRGRVAFERGPIVYCAEAVDQGEDIETFFVADDAELRAQHRPDLLGGVTVLTGPGHSVFRAVDGRVAVRDTELTLVPYYAWCNRGANKMAVWLPRAADLVKLPPPPTVASLSIASTSHINPTDVLGAVNDQQVPQSSSDHGVPRHTWWPRLGTEEWVQYYFSSPPTRVKAVEVYWFDDTGSGQCRVPESWRLLYRSEGDWKPVEATDFGTEKDKFNRVAFPAVLADGLRIVVQLQPGFSGGVLEWQVQEVE
jgi:hypothetical protein